MEFKSIIGFKQFRFVDAALTLQTLIGNKALILAVFELWFTARCPVELDGGVPEEGYQQSLC